jgi:hypothetical protein
MGNVRDTTDQLFINTTKWFVKSINASEVHSILGTNIKNRVLCSLVFSQSGVIKTEDIDPALKEYNVARCIRYSDKFDVPVFSGTTLESIMDFIKFLETNSDETNLALNVDIKPIIKEETLLESATPAI